MANKDSDRTVAEFLIDGIRDWDAKKFVEARANFIRAREKLRANPGISAEVLVLFLEEVLTLKPPK